MQSLNNLTEFPKIDKLKSILTSFGSVLVAFSGGVDSTFLLKAAVDFLGSGQVMAVTAKSETYPGYERKDAKKMAEKLDARWRTIESSEIAIPEFRDNPPDRCYYCKKELFEDLNSLAAKTGMSKVVDGTTRDDAGDHRPGMRAAKELDVVSPLKQSDLGKEEIREFSKKVGLETCNKPSFACLASRFPYGQTITEEKLTRVEEGEEVLLELGIEQFRVRHHENIARIEVRESDFEKVLKFKDKIVREFKDLGYSYVTLDMEGYKTGSMNRTLASQVDSG